MTPKIFSEFVGQDRAKARLELAIAAAKHRGEGLGHVLLVGSPGSGKSTLANIVAKAMGANIKGNNAQAIEKAGDLAGLLTNLEEGDILFIEDIQRLRRTMEEYLYPALKIFKLDVIIDQGAGARSVRLNLPVFTLIGTVPDKEQITHNFLSCFHIVENMDAYNGDELATIANRVADSIGLKIELGVAGRIARSSDGTPLDVLNRLRHIRDFAHVKGLGKITLEITETALKMLASNDANSESGNNRDAIPTNVRREVWRRDEGKCAKCGSRANLHYDHIIPVSKGGSNTARNIELLCEPCNLSKSDLIQ